ncbi:MAG TPA: response regulator transcription factor [Thermoanaerobaculia bacterium]|jgi:DNA-binding response OmpR family regulator|nr:response regulator transcription factor [Thermoanaerobaculia bacterium]
MRPLAIIEHADHSSALLRRDVEAAGFRADCFSNATVALTAIRRRAYALAILDLDVRDSDPFDVCRELSLIVPVITMTAEGGEDICVQAFEAGADDCVARTMNGREFIARVRNVLRRAADETPAASREFNTLSISLAEMRVRNGGTVHELSRGEAEVLTLLIEYSPAPITAVEMARILSANRATIGTRIKSLRRKLGPDRLVMRRKFGYELK